MRHRRSARADIRSRRADPSARMSPPSEATLPEIPANPVVLTELLARTAAAGAACDSAAADWGDRAEALAEAEQAHVAQLASQRSLEWGTIAAALLRRAGHLADMEAAAWHALEDHIAGITAAGIAAESDIDSDEARSLLDDGRADQ